MENVEKSLKWRVANFIWKILQRILPAKQYITLRYKVVFGRWVNWKNPTTFTEKLQWLKLYYYGQAETPLVDKILAKKKVAKIIGEGYIIPNIAEWDSADDINFDVLPEEYVLKCNHDSGQVLISNRSKPLDSFVARERLKKALRKNYYWVGRETPYRYIKPKVFAEPYITSKQDCELKDYKFHCFNGEPKVFKVDWGRFTEHHSNYYGVDGSLIQLGEVDSPPIYDEDLQLPTNLKEMIQIARKLSEGLPYARVDLYNVDGKILFGEITLFQASGFRPFIDSAWDELLGSWLTLPQPRI